MTKITTDFVGNETTAVTKQRLTDILAYWGASTAAYTTWGQARTALNALLTSTTAGTIGSEELAGSFLPKINFLNDPDEVIADALFGAGEQGVWFDPSDLTTLFQDTAGTAPVTTTGQSVGLMLDKSQGLVLGSELVVNGGFATDTDWTKGTGWTISGGVATKVAGSVGGLSQSMGIVLGVTYEITFTLTRTAGSLLIRLGTTAQNLAAFSASGTYTVKLAAAGSSGIGYFHGDATFAGTIDNISVKELPGNHAVQATTANRPIYGIHPFGGRRNLLTRTEEFANSVSPWGLLSAGGSTSSATLSNGAAGFTISATTARQYYSATFSNVPAGTYTLSIFVDSFSGPLTRPIFYSDTIGNPSQIFISGIVDGRASRTFTHAGGNMSFRLGIGTDANDTGTVTLGAIQLELGSTATAYQRVTDQYDVTEAGVSSVSYLFFDGVNDSLATSTITPGVDKAQVFAGVRKLSDAATGSLAGLSIAPQSNNGVFEIFAPGNAGSTYGWRTRGTVDVLQVPGTFSAPITNVLTGIGDISGDNSAIRINGTQVATSSNDQGTGNYLAYPLFIGARNSASNFFSGHLYSLIARFGPNLAAGQISSTETWVASRTGIVI